MPTSDVEYCRIYPNNIAVYIPVDMGRLRIWKSKEKEMAELLPGLPNDVVIMEILPKKLDVKSLGRCLCISKSWNKTLLSPEFINTHHRQSMLKSYTQLLFVGRHRYLIPEDMEEEKNEVKHHILTFSTAKVEDDTLTHIRLLNLPNYNKICQVLPVCHDLLCVVYVKDIQICNPWTGQVVTLPRRPPSFPWRDEPMVFGYVASRGEYLVVNAGVQSLFDTGGVVAVHMFSFKSSCNGNWKTIDDACPRKVRGGILIDNFVYWLIDSSKYEPDLPGLGRGKNELIVSLDVDKKKFKVINCPPTPEWESHLDLDSLFITLINLRGTVCLADQCSICDSELFQLWALNQWGWEKVYRVKLDFPLRYPSIRRYEFHFYKWLDRPPLEYPKSSSEGELIMNSPQGGTCYLYNPDTNRVRTATMPLPKANFAGMKFEYKSVAFFAETWPPTILY